jgi:hypothetical protein
LADKAKPLTDSEGFLGFLGPGLNTCPHFVVLASYHKGNDWSEPMRAIGKAFPF